MSMYLGLGLVIHMNFAVLSVGTTKIISTEGPSSQSHDRLIRLFKSKVGDILSW